MDETKPVADTGLPRPLLPTDLDAQDYVTVWDHGPRANRSADKRTVDPDAHAGAGGLSAGDATPKETEPDGDWYRKNGDGPVAMRMHATEAKQAMENEPLRYTMEPLVADEGAIADKVKEIQDRRAAAEKAAQDREAATQLALDRKEAIGAVMADRSADLSAKKAEDLQARSAQVTSGGSGFIGRPMSEKRARAIADERLPPKFGSQVSSGGSSAGSVSSGSVLSGGFVSSGTATPAPTTTQPPVFSGGTSSGI